VFLHRLLKKRFLCVAILLFVAGLVYGYFVYGFSTETSDDDSGDRDGNRGQPDGIVVEQGAEVVLRLLDRDGQVVCENRQRVPDELAGLSQREFVEKRPGWCIEEFSPRRIVVTTVVDGACEQHATSWYLGLSRGRVAVFKGYPGHCGELDRLTEIRVEDLPGEVVVRLRAGLAVCSEEELLQLLEGLSEGAAVTELIARPGGHLND